MDDDTPPTDDTRPKADSRTLVFAALRILGLATVLILMYLTLPLRDGSWWFDALVGFVAIAAIAPFTVNRVRALRTTDRPTLLAVEALLMQFSMLVFGFSLLYLVINRDGDQFADMSTRLDAVYFTVSTLSTVGFGDIHATGQMARLAVILQIAVDFTLLAVAVRLLLNTTRERLSPYVGRG